MHHWKQFRPRDRRTSSLTRRQHDRRGLVDMVPKASAIALVVNPANSAQAESTTREVQVAAHRFGIELNVLHASAEREFEAVFAKSFQLGAAALVIGPDPLFNSRSEQLGALAIRHAIPAICPYREFAMTGGLAAYGTNFPNFFRQLGVYTGRILKGDKPADLPVEQAVKLDLVTPLRNPTTGTADCCARAASGHAAAPPTSVMKSRRLMGPAPQVRGRRLPTCAGGPSRCLRPHAAQPGPSL
jgi:hypothetical protein